MPKGMLPAADSELAARIRTAIGVGPHEKIKVTTPQFDRPEHWPGPGKPPIGIENWWKLWHMNKADLRELGLGNWDGLTMLFPADWYDKIPKGFLIKNINGKVEEFKPGKTSNDRRFGALAFGVDAADGKEEL